MNYPDLLPESILMALYLQRNENEVSCWGPHPITPNRPSFFKAG